MKTTRYFNRDLSWIDFNERVLAEGLRRELPPIERFRYLAIAFSNFDEFFMIRVAGVNAARNVARKNSARTSEEIQEELQQILKPAFGDYYEGLTKKITFDRMIPPYGLEVNLGQVLIFVVTLPVSLRKFDSSLFVHSLITHLSLR